ncbi:MAG: hypothetical protein RL456_2440 [Pseudomonadota bacterium]
MWGGGAAAPRPGAGGVDADHLGGAAGQRRDAEAAGVAVAVQHRLASELAHQAREQRPVLALVEVVAGLVAFLDVDGQPDVVLVQRDGGRAFAAQPALDGLQALHLAHAGVAALEQARAAGGRPQRVGDRGLPALGAGAEELGAEDVVVAVDDQAGQAVGLAVDQPHAVAPDAQPRAHRHRRLDAAAEEVRVDALGLVEAPRPHPDHRARAERGPGEELAVVALDAHGLARIGAALVDTPLEHPGVLAQERALLAFTQTDGFHGARLSRLPCRTGMSMLHCSESIKKVQICTSLLIPMENTDPSMQSST